MKDKIKYLISIAVFVGFIAIVEHYFDWRDILSPWHKLSLANLLLTTLFIFYSYWARSMRIYDYFNSDMQGAYKSCLKLVLHHNMLNNLLPMRTGEISFPVLMLRYFNISTSKSIPALLYFRILDLHTLLSIALLVTVGYLYNIYIAIGVFFIWMGVPVVLFKTNIFILNKLTTRTNTRINTILVKCLSSLPQQLRAFIRSWIWTWINWIVKIGVSSWIILLFLDTSFNIAIMGAIMGDLTSVLPIYGIAGFGTYEAGILAGLHLFENSNNIINNETALQAAVYLHLIILGAAIAGGAIATLIPVENKQQDDKNTHKGI